MMFGGQGKDSNLRCDLRRIKGSLFQPGTVVPCDYLALLRMYRMFCIPTVRNGISEQDVGALHAGYEGDVVQRREQPNEEG